MREVGGKCTLASRGKVFVAIDLDSSARHSDGLQYRKPNTRTAHVDLRPFTQYHPGIG